MVEGILSITTGDSQLIVREKLGSLLSSKELAAMKQVNSDE